MKRLGNKLAGDVDRQDNQNNGQAEKASARYTYHLYCIAIFLTKY